MTVDLNVLRAEEKAVFALRTLYQKYGYSQYKMSKFEEYDLYVRNKDFLVSENVITFTDTDGKLMALKPDVTLSIIKNTKDADTGVQKVYYNENVYRVSKGTNTFKEIMQVGLECIGDVDAYCIGEVLKLAVLSLKSIAADFVLEISHLGIVEDILQKCCLSAEGEKAVVQCIREKNVGEIDKICAGEQVAAETVATLKQLVGTYGPLETVLPKIRGIADSCAVAQLENVLHMLQKQGLSQYVYLDFSVINNMRYYNGIVFNGFINGIPTSVLSGGQYDKLMKKMGSGAEAIGFAVYLDLLERLPENSPVYDVDAVILYDAASDLGALDNAVKLLTDAGKRVMVQKTVPKKIRYKQLLKLQERGLEIFEDNA